MLGGVAGCENERAFHQVHRNRALLSFAGVHKTVQLDRRRRTDRQHRLVAEHQLRGAVGFRPDAFVPVNIVAPKNGNHLSRCEIALHLVDDGLRPADALLGRGGRSAAEK
jgi:hypothetical protein